MSTAFTFVPSNFDVATGDPRLAGALVEIDADAGQATAIRRFMLDEAGLAAIQSPAAGPHACPAQQGGHQDDKGQVAHQQWVLG